MEGDQGTGQIIIIIMIILILILIIIIIMTSSISETKAIKGPAAWLSFSINELLAFATTTRLWFVLLACPCPSRARQTHTRIRLTKVDRCPSEISSRTIYPVCLKLVAGRFTVNRGVSFRRFCVGPPISSDRPRSSMEIGPLDASGSGGAGGEAAPLPVASLAKRFTKNRGQGRPSPPRRRALIRQARGGLSRGVGLAGRGRGESDQRRVWVVTGNMNGGVGRVYGTN
jgi:hypothetical protein